MSARHIAAIADPVRIVADLTFRSETCYIDCRTVFRSNLRNADRCGFRWIDTIVESLVITWKGREDMLHRRAP
ncbi:hypothetical protein DYI37_05415 [Fulvimarina endophytica]|uniref:Uncharacterized protein n=1 Tax=Fulvimarina endophytica TaxID=2293836 RepID=A0A371X7U6_9HYPH|nr:hypothetical protein DYI37_05415 [Fulvimarina endophytica]